MNPLSVIAGAAEDAAFVCQRSFGETPEVQLYAKDPDFTFAYIPSHLHHILFEVLKNSMRAVAEEHAGSSSLPVIKVVCGGGDEVDEVVIKVSDEGGGLARSAMSKVWSYFFTTARTPGETLAGLDFSRDSPAAGLGFGLPLSRLYARYFGGDLAIMSVTGLGVDVYITLKRVGTVKEPLLANARMV